MADERPKRIAEFIEPLRVTPGSKVDLARDFDPGYQGRLLKKKDGRELLQQGRRAAGRVPGSPRRAGHLRRARRAPGARRRGQGRHDPPRHERREPAGRRSALLQGAVGGGARPRLPVALRQEPARPRRDRHLQPLATTRRCSSCACTPRTSSASGCPEQARGRDVWKRRYREINDWERYLTDNGFRVVKLFLNLSQGRAAHPLPAAHRPARPQLEVLGGRRPGTRLLGRLPEGVLRDALGHEHRVGALVRDPGRPQVVRAASAPAAVIANALIEIDPRFPTVTDRPTRGARADQGRARGPGAQGRGGRPVRRPRIEGSGRERRPEEGAKKAEKKARKEARRPSGGRGRRGDGRGRPRRDRRRRLGRQARRRRRRDALVSRSRRTRSRASLGVDPASGPAGREGRGTARSATAPTRCRPRSRPGWRRFLDEYRSYMQIILVAAGDRVARDRRVDAPASLLLADHGVNAVVGLRQEGKAESAMNALKSMLKATARVRRDGAEAEIAGRGGRRRRRRAARGRRRGAGRRAHHPGERRCRSTSPALTGESVPAAKDADDARRRASSGPGDQSNMAFMNTPVTHGSGVMIVTGDRRRHRGRQDRRHALGDGQARRRR